MAKTNSCFNNMDITAKLPPNDCDPVSPIKISAGCELNQRKAKSAPIEAVQTITNSAELGTKFNSKYSE